MGTLDPAREYTGSIVNDWKRLFPQLDIDPYETGLRVLRMGRLLEKAMEAVATEGDLVVSGDYEVLATLRRAHPEPLGPAALAERTMITASGMTGRLDRLEGNGLVERRQNPSDRRGTHVHITPMGVEIADKVFVEVVAAMSRLFSSLRPAQVVQISEALCEALLSLGDTVPPDD